MTRYERNILFSELRDASNDKFMLARLSRMEQRDYIPQIHYSAYTLFGVPEWAVAYWENMHEWPKQWSQYVERLMAEAKLVEKRWKKQMSGCPTDLLNQVHCELDVDNYEYQPVFCATRGERPKEWDYLHIGGEQESFSRIGGFFEIRRGDWLLVVGLDFD